MKPVIERVPVAFERGMVGPEKTTMENFSHYYNPPSHFYQPAIKKKALEKNHRFWRNLELETLVPLSLPPPSSARLCALLSIESGMSRKREARGVEAKMQFFVEEMEENE